MRLTSSFLWQSPTVIKVFERKYSNASFSRNITVLATFSFNKVFDLVIFYQWITYLLFPFLVSLFLSLSLLSYNNWHFLTIVRVHKFCASFISSKWRLFKIKRTKKTKSKKLILDRRLLFPGGEKKEKREGKFDRVDRLIDWYNHESLIEWVRMTTFVKSWQLEQLLFSPCFARHFDHSNDLLESSQARSVNRSWMLQRP